MIDELTRQLFGDYPRQVANPDRWTIYDERGLTDFLMQNEGQKDCFISVYPQSGHIDKIFLDFDGHEGLCGYEQAFEDAKKVYKNLKDRGFCVVPLASGRKGTHLHILLRRHRYETPGEAKMELYNATLQILVDTFGEIEQGTEYDRYNKPSTVYYAVEDKHRIIGADPRVIGDIQRICRIPNTRRPPNNGWSNWSWCTWLPEHFEEMSWTDAILWCKEPHWYNTRVTPKKYIHQLPKYSGRITVNPMANPAIFEHTLPIKTNTYLESQLRPCLYRSLMVSNPLHHARVAATIDLLQFHKPQIIAELYRQLNWVDFDANTTVKQIYLCDKYKPYNCLTLKQHGLCLYEHRSDCPIVNGMALVTNGKKIEVTARD